MVLAFLDLDTAEADPDATQWVTDLLRTQLKMVGPARVSIENIPSWSETELIRKTAQATNSRTVLTGTVRNVAGTRRISLRLSNQSGDQSLFRTALDQPKTSVNSSRKPQP